MAKQGCLDKLQGRPNADLLVHVFLPPSNVWYLTLPWARASRQEALRGAGCSRANAVPLHTPVLPHRNTKMKFNMQTEQERTRISSRNRKITYCLLSTSSSTLKATLNLSGWNTTKPTSIDGSWAVLQDFSHFTKTKKNKQKNLLLPLI